MHAHDHVAMLLAAAQHLSKHRHFDGLVYLIFVPAEEGRGAICGQRGDGKRVIPLPSQFHSGEFTHQGQGAITQGKQRRNASRRALLKWGVKRKSATGFALRSFLLSPLLFLIQEHQDRRIQKTATGYTYPQLPIQKLATRPGSILDRQGGSLFNRR